MDALNLERTRGELILLILWQLEQEEPCPRDLVQADKRF